jgi:hypothetical protein
VNPAAAAISNSPTNTTLQTYPFSRRKSPRTGIAESGFGQDGAVSDRAATIMLVHGAWHGSWGWEQVRQRLHDRGIATAAVDNPSVTRPGSDLHADGDNLRPALDAGESVTQNELRGGKEMKLGESLQFDGEVVSVDPSRIVEFFYHDCAPDDAEAAAARLEPMSLAAMGGVPRGVAWRDVPSTYVVCTDDRRFPSRCNVPARRASVRSSSCLPVIRRS